MCIRDRLSTYGRAHLSDLGCADNAAEYCAERDHVYKTYFTSSIVATRVRITPQLCGERCAGRFALLLAPLRDMSELSEWACHGNLFGMCERTLRHKEWESDRQRWTTTKAQPLYRPNTAYLGADEGEECVHCLGHWLRKRGDWSENYFPGNSATTAASCSADGKGTCG